MAKTKHKTAKKRTQTKKSDSTEIQKRVNSVYIMLLQGYQRKHVIQYCAENYQVKERQADEYIAKARETMNTDMEVEMETKKVEILSQLYHLYQRSMKIEDFRECRAILKEVSEILGVKAPKKIDHTTKGGVIGGFDWMENLSTEALEEIERVRLEHQQKQNES